MRPTSALIALIVAAGPLRGADQPAIDTSQIVVGIDSIKLTRFVYFPDGDLSRATGNDHGGVRLHVAYGDHPPVGFGLVHCTSALTDAGEELVLPPEDERTPHQLVRLFGRKAGPDASRPYIPMGLSIKVPARPAKALARLSGTIALDYETEPGETIELKPASDWVGKVHEIPGMPAGITIINLSPLTYRCDRELATLEFVTASTVHDAEGTAIPNQENHGFRTSDDGSGPTVTREGITVPPDGSIRITLPGKTTTVSVPFELKDIPLDAPPAPAPAPPPASDF